MRALLFVVACLAPSIVLAEPPVPDIQGPVSGTPGDIVELDASGSTAEQFSWIVDTSGVAVPTGALTHKPMNDGRVLVLASYPGTWRVYLLVANSEGIRFQSWTVEISGDGPTPPPPGDELDLSDEARQWLQSVPQQYRTVQQDVRLTIKGIGEIAEQANSIPVLKAMLEFGLNNAVSGLGDNKDEWDQFAGSMNAALGALQAQGLTPGEYGQALLSIAKGLE